MIFQFVPAFLVSNFASRLPLIGDICALLGICWILGNIFLYKAALGFFRRKTILCISGCALSCLVFLSFFSSSVQIFTFILCLGSFFASMCWPVCTSIISDRSSPSHQGKIMGLTQSFQSLAMFIAPFMIAPFIAKDSLLPFSIAAASGLIFVLITSLTPIEEK
jgi:predicted MFS family arabinose efflux permease